MSVFKRNAIWWYRFKFKGQHIRRSGSNNKALCERLEREHRRRLELNQGGLTEIAKPKRCSVAMTEVREANEPHWAKKTRNIHANSQLQHLDPFFGKLLLSEITADHISRYQGMRHKAGASNRTINIEIGLLRLSMRKHKLWANLADDVKALKERKDIGRELSDDEQQRLLTACKVNASRSLYPAVLTPFTPAYAIRNCACLCGVRSICGTQRSRWARARRKVAKADSCRSLRLPYRCLRSGALTSLLLCLSTMFSRVSHTA